MEGAGVSPWHIISMGGEALHSAVALAVLEWGTLPFMRFAQQAPGAGRFRPLSLVVHNVISVTVTGSKNLQIPALSYNCYAMSAIASGVQSFSSCSI